VTGTIDVVYDGRGTLAFIIGSTRLAGPAGIRVMRQTLSGAGDKTRTAVRRALRDQMGVKRYGTIVAHTRSYMHSGGLAYSFEGSGKGLPIEEFPVRAGAGGVVASPWRVSRLFKRSFVKAGGGYRARLGRSRFPIRKLYGPAPAKEVVKDEALATFLRVGPAEVARILPLRMARLIP
jgi:hypothetical protein